MQPENKNDSVQLSTRYQQYDFAKRHLGGFGGRQVFPITGDFQQTATVAGYISEEDWPRRHEQIRRVYKTDGAMPTIPTGQGGGVMTKIAIPVLTPDRIEKRQNGRRFKEDGEPMFTLTGQDKHGIMTGHCLDKPKIRRLTPKECERLMGLPDVEKTIIIDICDEIQKQEIVSSVTENTQSKNQVTKEPAPLIVQVFLDEKSIKIWQEGNETELWLDANNADKSKKFQNRDFVEGFVRMIAGLNIILERITPNGKVELHQNVQSSIHQDNGKMRLLLCGKEMMRDVKNVEKDLTIPNELLKSITLEALSTKNCEPDLRTLSSCVIRVITGFIPEKILNDSSLLRIEIVSRFGWTEGVSDTQRYKLAGNGVCIPVVKAIVEKLIV